MIANDLYADMALMYELLGLVPQGHLQLKQAVAEQVKIMGRDLYASDQANTSFTQTGSVNQAATIDSKSMLPFIVWIEKTLQLKLKFHTVLEKCFQNDISFEGEINIALQSVIALHPKNSEFISLYLDHHLRGVSKGKLDLNEFEVIGENAISVFQYLSEKDIFERYYKQHLAKRLLYVKSISEDAEKGILGKLKVF
jgi:cullin 3